MFISQNHKISRDFENARFTPDPLESNNLLVISCSRFSKRHAFKPGSKLCEQRGVQKETCVFVKNTCVFVKNKDLLFRQ
jgi:hypothetical protein